MPDLESQVRRWFDVVHARDFHALADMYTADAIYVRADGTSKGPTEIVAYLQRLTGAFPDHGARIEAVLVSGDAVTVEWTETATHTTSIVRSRRPGSR